MYKRTNTSSLYMPITAPGAVSNNYPQTQMDADEGIFIPAKTWNGVTPGTAGGQYIWIQPARPDATWTQATR